MANDRSIAVLGAGRMGAAMVKTLRSAGLDVTVYNRSVSKAEAAAAETGAQVATTAAAAVADASIVVSSLADDAAVQSVYTGPEGAAAGLQGETVVLETSTIDPGTLQLIRPAVEANGAMLVDAPVSGSVSLVEAGKLTVMAGGDAEAIARAAPVLDALAAQVFHVGSLGAGATMKLAVNAIVHALNVAVSEALVLAEMAGVDRATAYEVFAASAAGAPYVAYKQTAFEKPENTAVAFTLDLVAKDLDLILSLADGVGAPMVQSQANRSVAGQAIKAGYGERDMSAVAAYLRAGREQ